MAPEPRGFAGLTSLIPKIEVEALPAASASAAVPAASERPAVPGVASPPAKVDRDTGPLSVKIILGLIVVGIIWAVIDNNSGQPSREQATTDTAATPSSTFDPSTAVPVAPAPAVPPWLPVTEIRPDTSYKPILSANEIAYCLAEELRMNTAKPLVNQHSHAEIAGFNARVEDYNARCSRYEYETGDMPKAQEYLESHRTEIMQQARGWPARWRRGRSTSGLESLPRSATDPLVS